MIAVYQVALDSTKKGATKRRKGNNDETSPSSNSLVQSKPLTPIHVNAGDQDRDYRNLIQLMEEAVMSRDANRTNVVVGGLVQHIVTYWREQFCKSVVTKYNCYFMLPFVDDFHRYIRKELHAIYEGEGEDLADVFDLTSARRSLQIHRDELVNECRANKRLQEKFQICARMMANKKDDSPDADYETPYIFKSFDDKDV